MDIYVSKSMITNKLSEIAAELEAMGLSTKLNFDCLTKKFRSCELESKNLYRIAGELLVFCDGVAPEDGVSFVIEADCKGGVVDDVELAEEISAIEQEKGLFVDGISADTDAVSYLKEYLAKEKAIADEMLGELNRNIARTNKISLITVSVGVGILIVLAIVMLLLK